jgi:hypothetical protein
MATFVEFIDSNRKAPVVINPEHVVKVTQGSNDPVNTSAIDLVNGSSVAVQGDYAGVIQKLTTA